MINAEDRDPRDYARTENLQNMSKHMETHEQMCPDCAYLKQYGFLTRCAEYQSLQDIRAYWKDRIEVQA